jgi:hypothetical protein
MPKMRQCIPRSPKQTENLRANKKIKHLIFFHFLFFLFKTVGFKMQLFNMNGV